MAAELKSTDDYLVGIISDTHGLLRPEAVEVFKSADFIIHAGDIGKPEILEALRRVAPLFAVRGNMDMGGWALALPKTEVVGIGEALLYVLHDLYELDLDPAAAGFSGVISGHTHRAGIDERNGVVFLNPGAAGPFRPPVSVGLLRIQGSSLEAELIKLAS